MGRQVIAWLVVAAACGALACADSASGGEATAGAPGAAPVSNAGAAGAALAPAAGAPVAAGAGAEPAPAGAAAGEDPAAPEPAAAPGGDPAPAPPERAAPPSAPRAAAIQRIYWLDILGNGVHVAGADGSEPTRVAEAAAAPDGIVTDDCRRAVYFTNMGSALGGSGLASVQRLQGGSVDTLVAPGSGINTAKQLAFDSLGDRLYIADREGASIWRSRTDGSELERMVSGHDFSQLVGVAVDSRAGFVYFTDRQRRQVWRMGLEIPGGESHDTRSDVELLYQAPDGAMPIDLALDLEAGRLYLTDRRLGTVQRMGLTVPAGETPETRTDVETLVDGLVDTIGIAVSSHDQVMYFTELSGAVHRASLDGSGDEVIARSGSATGIALSILEDPSQSIFCD